MPLSDEISVRMKLGWGMKLNAVLYSILGAASGVNRLPKKGRGAIVYFSSKGGRGYFQPLQRIIPMGITSGGGL